MHTELGIHSAHLLIRSVIWDRRRYYNALSTFITYYAYDPIRDYEDSKFQAMIAIITARLVIRVAETLSTRSWEPGHDNTTSRWGAKPGR